MNTKFMSAALALLFIITIVPANTSAGYSLAITGMSEFTGTPYQAETFAGAEVYVRIYLSDTSPSSLIINMTVEGDLANYITFPEFAGAPSFTLFPGQNRKVLYNLSLPLSAPGKYSGTILAIGNPPASELTNATGAIGKPVVGITITADIPSEVQIYDFVTLTDGFPDQQWSDWGDGWSTNLSVVNGGDTPFSGWCNLTLEGGLFHEIRSFNIVNLSVAGNITFGHDWPDGLPLNTQYDISAVVESLTGETKDEEHLAFTIPSPADIISVERSPEQVFQDDTVEVYAILASSDSTVTLHWRVDNGTEETSDMLLAGGEYSATIPSQTWGSSVQYWVTSLNGAFTGQNPPSGAYSYYVFSPDMPDLAISLGSLTFSPIDPVNETINETDVTNMYILVRNLGRGSITDAIIRVYDGETPIWNSTIPYIAAQGSAIAIFSWWPLQGTHILRFEVDPDNAVLELDENNNHITLPEITVGVAPEIPPTSTEEDVDSLINVLPFVVIPLILVLLIFLLLKRKKVVCVTVEEVKQSRHTEDGVQKVIYTCSIGGKTIGTTKATKIRVDKGSVIKVKVTEIREDDEGALTWWDPVVIGAGTEEDSEEKIKKLIKKSQN